MCAFSEEPRDNVSYGPDDCIECSGPVDSHAPADGNWTEGWGEPCPPGVYCMFDPTTGEDAQEDEGDLDDVPADADDDGEDAEKDSPLPGALLLIGAFALAAVALAIRRN
jgi:hypothetical protein